MAPDMNEDDLPAIKVPMWLVVILLIFALGVVGNMDMEDEMLATYVDRCPDGKVSLEGDRVYCTISTVTMIDKLY